mgnify:CR=1 FL=1
MLVFRVIICSANMVYKTMNEQLLINIGLGLISFLGGWLLRIVWQRMDDQERRHVLLNEAVTELRINVSGDYVTRSELATNMNTLTQTLLRIEDKLDRKQDK